MSASPAPSPAPLATPYTPDSGIPDPTMPLHQRAVLIALKISAWKGARLDKRASREVARNHNAAETAGIYRKRLVVDDKLQEIHTTLNGLRADISDLSLSWSHGVRILPVALLPQAQRLIAAAEDSLAVSLSSIREVWPSIVEAQQDRLGSLFQPSDYPADIARHFSIHLSVMKVPESGDFRVNLADDSMAILRSTVEEDVARAMKSTQADVLNRVLPPIQRLAERLEALDSSERTRFYDTTVTSILDMIPALRALNLQDNAEVDALLNRFHGLARHTPNQLKADPVSRSTIRDEARNLARDVEQTLNQMDGLF